jgi:Dolichyl-phosphate-mannose-protein mannosyltransferase
MNPVPESLNPTRAGSEASLAFSLVARMPFYKRAGSGLPRSDGERSQAPHRSWCQYVERHALVVSLTLIVIATVRVILTYPVFSHTYDEPSHIAGGMEWLDQKVYTIEPKHPPLARVMTALGPYLAGERSHRAGERGRDHHDVREGVAILGAHYDRVLTLARVGTLPFLWISAWVIYAWSRRYFDAMVAVMAVFLFTQLPAILAHSGLATNDMAVTAFVGASAYTALVWLEKPTVGYTLLMGTCLGLAVLSKFSSLVFLPSALLTMGAWYVLSERPSAHRLLAAARPRLALLPLSLIAAGLTIWAGYRFSVGPVHFAGVWLPAPELYSGVAALIEHNRGGHASYLLGQRSPSGWWYFFPLALAVKTPLAFLFLVLGGSAMALRRTPVRWPLAYAVGLLLCVLPSRINIGTRHILAIYIGLAILAAVFAVEGMRRWRTRRAFAAAVIGALAWFTVSVGVSHPDYLPYFNAIAGREPEKILVDSDLDWGQDLKRLAKHLQEVGATEVAALPPFEPSRRDVVRASLELVAGFPPLREIDPVTPSPGWNAVSLTVLYSMRMGVEGEGAQGALWPELIKPTERVGKGLLLYYFPPAQPP